MQRISASLTLADVPAVVTAICGSRGGASGKCVPRQSLGTREQGADAPRSPILFLPALLLFAQQPLIQRLEGSQRAKVLAALAGLVILGFAMVLLTWLGGRVTRRYMRGPQRYEPKREQDGDDWAQSPRRKVSQTESDEGGAANR